MAGPYLTLPYYGTVLVGAALVVVVTGAAIMVNAAVQVTASVPVVTVT